MSGLVKKFKEIELHLREIQRILKLSKQQEDTGRMIQKYGRFNLDKAEESVKKCPLKLPKSACQQRKAHTSLLYSKG